MKYFLIAILMLSSCNIVFAQKKNKNGAIYTLTLTTYTSMLDVLNTDTLFFVKFANKKRINVLSKEKLVLTINEKGSVEYCDSLYLKDTNMMVYSFLYRRLFHSPADSFINKGREYDLPEPRVLFKKRKKYVDEFIIFEETYVLKYCVQNNFITFLNVIRQKNHKSIGYFALEKIRTF